MKYPKYTFHILTGLLIITSLLAFQGLIGKGKASPPLVINITPDTLRREHLLGNDKPWENYPELVAQSRNEMLSAGTMREIGIGAGIISNREKLVFFRSHLGTNENDSLLAVSLLPAFKASSRKVVMLVDQYGMKYLEKIGLSDAFKEYALLIVRDVPVRAENYRFSYFFRMEGIAMKDIFFPKYTLTALTDKYLTY